MFPGAWPYCAFTLASNTEKTSRRHREKLCPLMTLREPIVGRLRPSRLSAGMVATLGENSRGVWVGEATLEVWSLAKSHLHAWRKVIRADGPHFKSRFAKNLVKPGIPTCTVSHPSVRLMLETF